MEAPANRMMSVDSIDAEIRKISSNHQLTVHEQEEAIRLFLQDALHVDQREHVMIKFLIMFQSQSAERLKGLLKVIKFYHNLFNGFVLNDGFVELIQVLSGKYDTESKTVVTDIILHDLKNNRLENFKSESYQVLLHYCSHNLGSEDLALFQVNHNVLSYIGRIDFDTTVLVLHQDSQKYLASNTTVYVRYAALLVEVFNNYHKDSQDKDISSLSTSTQNALNQLLEIFFNSKDLLLQITLLELIALLATTIPGLNYLVDKKVVDQLIEISFNNQELLLQGDALRCLGTIFAQATRHSFHFVDKVSDRCTTHLLNLLQEHLESNEEAAKITGLAILSDFAIISASSLFLTLNYKQGALFQAWLQLLNASRSELQGAAIQSFVKVFDQSDQQLLDNDALKASSSGVTHTVFHFPGLSGSKLPTTLEEIITLKKQILEQIATKKRCSIARYLTTAAKQPVDSIHNAAIDLMRAIVCTSQMISEQMVTGSDFFQYLQFRESEFSKEGKDLKFSLIQAVYQHPGVHLLPAIVHEKLKKIIAQGPYYMPPRMQELETI